MTYGDVGSQSESRHIVRRQWILIDNPIEGSSHFKQSRWYSGVSCLIGARSRPFGGIIIFFGKTSIHYEAVVKQLETNLSDYLGSYMTK